MIADSIGIRRGDILPLSPAPDGEAWAWGVNGVRVRLKQHEFRRLSCPPGGQEEPVAEEPAPPLPDPEEPG